MLGVGRSQAKVFDAERPSTKFADVAGYEGAKEEITEVIDFLRNPDRYQRAGAMAPRGVLMVGPPGTGKTLLARAVAGEASVPFFSVTGSSFVEMFVGVGAARVRDLFTEARKRAPAIIFVDEIDAIGQRRGGSGAVVANDEREQTLNQLLSEMDGFDMTQGIVVLGATNRPEVLDPALLRPGRFDRQVIDPAADAGRAGRDPGRALPRQAAGPRRGPEGRGPRHARLLRRGPGQPGQRGGDLRGPRATARCSPPTDFDDARDRILLGRREGSNVLLPEEKHAVAVHEAGHALVAALSEHADPVAKVTILPAGQALGVTEQLPLVERHLYGEDYLPTRSPSGSAAAPPSWSSSARGRPARPTTWPSATDLATRMVREFGLSPALGPVGYPEGGSVFLGGGGNGAVQPAVRRGDPGHHRRRGRPAAPRGRADRGRPDPRAPRRAGPSSSSCCWRQETVDGAEVYRIAGRPVPEHRPVEPMAIAPHTGPVPAGQRRPRSRPAPATPPRPTADQPPGPGPDPGAGPRRPANLIDVTSIASRWGGSGWGDLDAWSSEAGARP